MSSPFSKAALVLSVVLLLLSSAGICLAEEGSGVDGGPWKRFEGRFGGFWNALDSNVMLGAEGLGLNVDVEDLLGLKASTTAYNLAGFWRYTQNRRHRLDAGWFSVHRGTDHQLTRDIEIGDTLFIKGTRLKSRFNIDIYKVAYSYSFFQDDRVDLALSAGMFVMPVSFEASITGEATKGVRSADITAPLPVFGFRTDTSLTPRWCIRSGFELFYIKIGEFTGAITDLTATVEYNPYKNLGFGLGFEDFGLKVKAEGSNYPGVDFKGRLDFGYVGLLFYVKGMI